MESQLTLGLLLIFIIFILICIYTMYIKQIHEDFSDVKKHGFWDHHPLANLWTNHVSLDGYDFSIDPTKGKIKIYWI